MHYNAGPSSVLWEKKTLSVVRKVPTGCTCGSRHMKLPGSLGSLINVYLFCSLFLFNYWQMRQTLKQRLRLVYVATPVTRVEAARCLYHVNSVRSCLKKTICIGFNL